MSTMATLGGDTNTVNEQRLATLPPGGFEEIYDAYHGRIFGLAYRMMGNADEALDVTQDAFISAYLNLHKLRPDCREDGSRDVHLAAWLHRIAANKCIDALRKRKHLAGVDWDVYAKTVPSPSDNGHPELHVLGRERDAEVQRVLIAMTPGYRLVLLLQGYQGLSVREISQTVDRSESAVKSMLFRAREQFRSLYEHERGAALDRVA